MPGARKISQIMEKIQRVDGIILATPVYNQHITALLKKTLDYMTYLWHRPALFGKRFMAVSSGGGMFWRYIQISQIQRGGLGRNMGGGVGCAALRGSDRLLPAKIGHQF